MTDWLRSNSGIDKSNHDKVDDLVIRMQQMQEQVQEILLEMRISPAKTDSTDLATRLTAIEAKLTNQTVCTSRLQPSTSLPHAHTHHITKSPFKMEISRFNRSDSLGWVFKINHFHNFHKIQEEQCISIFLFRWSCPQLVSVDV